MSIHNLCSMCDSDKAALDRDLENDKVVESFQHNLTNLLFNTWDWDDLTSDLFLNIMSETPDQKYKALLDFLTETSGVQLTIHNSPDELEELIEKVSSIDIQEVY